MASGNSKNFYPLIFNSLRYDLLNIVIVVETEYRKQKEKHYG